MRTIKRRLPRTPAESTPHARELRTQQTNAERLLWSRLRTKRMNTKFRRQEPIGPYIVDFVCIEKGLIVELDGSQHCQPEGKLDDAMRDSFLNSLGFKVLRFSNYDVLKNLDGVVSTIWENLPPLNPPREPGGR